MIRERPASQRPVSTPASAIGRHYENNAYHVSQGSKWYRWFNCNGCHANGGGGMGPALIDDQWRYGSQMEQIYATIVQGRPNGMPAYRGRLPDASLWQLTMYVRSLSGLAGKVAATGRQDHMFGVKPPNSTPRPKTLESEPSRPPTTSEVAR